jgi:hypothetical protein
MPSQLWRTTRICVAFPLHPEPKRNLFFWVAALVWSLGWSGLSYLVRWTVQNRKHLHWDGRKMAARALGCQAEAGARQIYLNCMGVWLAGV